MVNLSLVREALRQAPGEWSALADMDSRRRMMRLRLHQLRHGDAGHPRAENAVPLRVKALGAHALFVRPRSSDIDMIWCTYVANWHLPPAEVQHPRCIVELGTNIGAGLSGLAARYPDARLLGVEPDPQNAALARRNLSAFGARCRVEEAAIWDVDTTLVIERSRREWGLVVRPRTPDDPPDWPSVRARSVDSVLAEFEPDQAIDYMFMDIEGVEHRVLEAENLGWAQRVRSIRVESEREYGGEPQRCASALRALGFETRIEPHSWGAFVFGVR
jgi:FkbM family methyltransferase